MRLRGLLEVWEEHETRTGLITVTARAFIILLCCFLCGIERNSIVATYLPYDTSLTIGKSLENLLLQSHKTLI